MNRYGDRLEALFTGVLLACGPRPHMFARPPDKTRMDWRREIVHMLGETVNQNQQARAELHKSYMRWYHTRENHAKLATVANQEDDDE